MSFNVALSGLRAANQDLNVTGNNIANAGTTGFKQSRAEFADVYATSLLGSGARSPGNGVLVADIAQQFTQGNISITNNSLDLAISGQGFFVLQEQGGSRMYTRSGIFGLDKEGYVVGNNGARLQGFGADASGHIVEGAPHALRIETTDVSPKATTEISMRFNLDSREVGPRDDSGLKEFRPLDATSYNWSTAATVYDSLGNPHTLTTYYQKRDAAPGDPAATPPVPAVEEGWNMFIQIGNRFVSPTGETQATIDAEGNWNWETGVTALTPHDLTFNDQGGLVGGDTLSLANIDVGGAAPLAFDIDLGGSTQYGDTFSVKTLNQNGYAPGRLTGVSIDDTGVIFARYSNGESQQLGKVALANFANPQGLVPIGGTNWVESFESGQPVIGSPQTGALGSIQSGALEDSNVDLSMELVNLIIAQRNYQANAKTIETANAVTQTIINLR